MLPGGVAGLLFSYVLVFIFRNALLVPGFNLLGTSRGCLPLAGDAAQYVGLRVRLRGLRRIEPAFLDAARLEDREGEYNGCVEWINRRYGYDNTYIETDKVPHGGSGWILAELLVVFVVIWFMTSYFLMMGKSWYEPVGYDLEGVYHAVLAVRPSNSPSFVTYEEGGDEAARDVERIVERLRGHADVEAVALSVSSLPYTLSWSGSRVTRDSVSVSVRLMTVSPDYFRVFGIRPASGESPERLGEALSGTREGRDRVISAELARRLYGTTDAIGADIYLHGDTLPGHVVAVTGPVRNDEFDRRKQCILFSLLDLRELNDLTQVQITFRLRPSVATAGYADRFLKAMKRQLMVGNFWVSEVRAYPDVRSSYLENSIESNAQRIVSALGLFLLTNVFLAVIGTFWFHVSRRRAELGLRMAMGSTRASILGLVMGEGLMLLTIATVPALLICVNLAWIDLMPPGLVESKVGCFLINSLLTWLILALIISLATWYPARKASSLEPADALRYDG